MRLRAVPVSFVEMLSRAKSEAMDSWLQAREQESFAVFAPKLERLVQLKKEEANLYQQVKLGLLKGEVLYDELLHEFEKGVTVQELDQLFNSLKVPLTSHLAKVARDPHQYKGGQFGSLDQVKFSRMVVEKLGFDFGRGRLDESVHPFCEALHPDDVRITIRFDETDPIKCFLAAVHEAGHGMYEQGLPKKAHFSLAGKALSAGVHESQSLFWEKQIALSREFWNYWRKSFQEHFPFFQTWDVSKFYNRFVTASPSFIRVDADELTYPLHVILRYELERDLFAEKLTVEDLEQAWNGLVKKYLGLDVPTPSLGILQDIHWAFGLFGYFPTYALGAILSAQIADRLDRELNGFRSQVSLGDYGSILSFLRSQVHEKASFFPRRIFLEELVGGMNAKPYLNYLINKFQ